MSVSKPKLDSWSISKLQVYEVCPRRAKLAWIDKIPNLQLQKAADRGTSIHSAAEKYVNGARKAIVPELKHFVPELVALRRHYLDKHVFVEGEWGFDREWKVCDWKKAWLRLKIDALDLLSPEHAAVIDLKGLALDTWLPTPTGWTTMGDVRVGDELFDTQGRPCTVLGKSEVKRVACYKIVFDDTTGVVCDKDHLWTLCGGCVVPVTELEPGDCIPVAAPAQYRRTEKLETLHPRKGVIVEPWSENLPIHPYVFGCWLGDGKVGNGEITNPEDFIWEEIERCGYSSTEQNWQGKIDHATGYAKCRVGSVVNLRAWIRHILFDNKKHIPECYKRASVEDRVALIQGLMDTDGSVNQIRGQATIGMKSSELIEDVFEVLCGLGIRVNHNNYIAKGFGLEISATVLAFRPSWFNPFRLPRKAESVAPYMHNARLTTRRATKFDRCRNTYRRVRSVTEIESVPTQCIVVDSSDHSFLCTERFLPTHNSGARFGNELKHAVQLQLYAVCTLLRFPLVNKATCELFYTDHNELTRFEMLRSQLERFRHYFDRKARGMTEDTTFVAKPSPYACKWCPYSAERQNECHSSFSVAKQLVEIGPPPKMVSPKLTKLAEVFKERLGGNNEAGKKRDVQKN